MNQEKQILRTLFNIYKNKEVYEDLTEEELKVLQKKYREF